MRASGSLASDVVAPEEVPARWADKVTEPAPLDDAASHHMVPMRDGVRLAADVYLPPGTVTEVPVIVMRLPYDKCGRFTFVPQIARYFNAHGYALVAQDVRGKFRSEGERTPGVFDVADGYDTLDWVVHQPWCDGTLGMFGDSYYGFTQWAAAASGHPALRAIVPRFASQEGPARWFKDESVVRAVGLDWLVDIFSLRGIMLEGGAVDWTQRPYDKLIPTDLPNAQRVFDEFRALGDDLPALFTTIYPDGLPAPRLNVPALHVGGWWDVAKTWQLSDWRQASQGPAAADQFLVMAAVDHYDLAYSLDGRAPESMLAGDAELERYLPRMLDAPIAFFDRYVRGRSDVAAPPRVRYEIANAGWATAAAWPPPGLDELTLHLGAAERATASIAGGTLAREPEPAVGHAAWTHDPDHPVPDLSAGDWELLAALPDECVAHGRADVATFTAPVTHEAIDIVGPVRAELTVDSSAPSTHVVVTLCDVTSVGRANMICEGVAAVVTGAGEVAATVELGDTAYRLLPGHRLRLAVCSSRFPRYLTHPGTDESVWTAEITMPARQKLHAGGGRASLVRLGVLRR